MSPIAFNWKDRECARPPVTSFGCKLRREDRARDVGERTRLPGLAAPWSSEARAAGKPSFEPALRLPLTSPLSPSFVSLSLSLLSAPAPPHSFSPLRLEERVPSCSVDGEEAAAPRSLRGLGRQARGVRGGDSAAAPPSASSCRLAVQRRFPLRFSPPVRLELLERSRRIPDNEWRADGCNSAG